MFAKLLRLLFSEKVLIYRKYENPYKYLNKQYI